jgi:N-acetylglutamate synthase-like GNAT family acetyltransferase
MRGCVNETPLALEPAAFCGIREATEEDSVAIEGLYRQLVSDPLICVIPAQVAAFAASPTSFLLVAETGGVVCATALLVICPDAMYRAQPFGVVENVIVTEAMRGRGIGGRLLAHIEALAIAQQCSKLMLLSSAPREPAHAFFRRCGFMSDAKRGFVKYRRQFSAP